MVLKTWKWVDASWQSLSWKNTSKISRKQGKNCFHQGATMEKIQNCQVGDFPVVQWLWFGASNAGHIGSIPGQGTKIPTCYVEWSNVCVCVCVYIYIYNCQVGLKRCRTVFYKRWSSSPGLCIFHNLLNLCPILYLEKMAIDVAFFCRDC